MFKKSFKNVSFQIEFVIKEDDSEECSSTTLVHDHRSKGSGDTGCDGQTDLRIYYIDLGSVCKMN